MKKHWFLLLLLTLSLFMASCGNHNGTPTTILSESKAASTEASVGAENTIPAPSNLASLSDYDLFETVHLQLWDMVYSYPSESAAMEAMTQAQRVFYVLSMYDMEMQNGGLCQFFTNTSSTLVADVEHCLEILGADAHRDLFVDFMETNRIDSSVLESFVIYDVDDYIEHTERYDFDSFDMAYYDLPPLFGNLVEYVRRHIDEF
ncbi:MAG: DUF4375 domain-containing protein [Oscillospiraceae bacterium]|nr:DUF4375 domain-containing protein [Oscillospiraceae bacterium]